MDVARSDGVDTCDRNDESVLAATGAFNFTEQFRVHRGKQFGSKVARVQQDLMVQVKMVKHLEIWKTKKTTYDGWHGIVSPEQDRLSSQQKQLEYNALTFSSISTYYTNVVWTPLQHMVIPEQALWFWEDGLIKLIGNLLWSLIARTQKLDQIYSQQVLKILKILENFFEAH